MYNVMNNGKLVSTHNTIENAQIDVLTRVKGLIDLGGVYTKESFKAANNVVTFEGRVMFSIEQTQDIEALVSQPQRIGLDKKSRIVFK